MSLGIGGQTGGQSGSSGSTIQQILQTLTSGSGSQSVTPDQNPAVASFQQSMLPAIAQQYAKAQQPVYGQPQINQAIQSANTTYDAAAKAAEGNAARRGVTDSGASDAMQTSLAQNKAAQVTNFTNQIPFLNEQEQFNRTNGLLGLASGFLSSVPVGQTTNYNNTQTGTQSSGQTGTATNQSGNWGFGGNVGI